MGKKLKWFIYFAIILFQIVLTPGRDFNQTLAVFSSSFSQFMTHWYFYEIIIIKLLWNYPSCCETFTELLQRHFGFTLHNHINLVGMGYYKWIYWYVLHAKCKESPMILYWTCEDFIVAVILLQYHWCSLLSRTERFLNGNPFAHKG